MEGTSLTNLILHKYKEIYIGNILSKNQKHSESEETMDCYPNHTKRDVCLFVCFQKGKLC